MPARRKADAESVEEAPAETVEEAVKPKPKPKTAAKKKPSPQTAAAEEAPAPAARLLVRVERGPVIIGGKSYYDGEIVEVSHKMAAAVDAAYPEALAFRALEGGAPTKLGKWLANLPKAK